MTQKCGRCGGLGCLKTGEKNFARAVVCDCKKECGECGGRGVTVRTEGGYRCKISCPQCGAVHENVKKYNRARLPAASVRAELKPQNQSELSGVAAQYISRFINAYPGEKGFVLSGPPGCGKTSLASTAIGELTLKQGIDCRFQDFGELIRAVRKGMEEGVGEHNFLEPLLRAEVVAICGVGGARSLTDWEKSLLEGVISQRYGASQKLILTTKYGARKTERPHVEEEGGRLILTASGRSELENEIGEQAFSRLGAMCRFLSLE